ncbi:MAG: inorganic diphosphatase [Candidatus Dojkabacteria bacterium]|nr:inorganic diphosphatase [Candidatus Dojkabacteria bacterium]
MAKVKVPKKVYKYMPNLLHLLDAYVDKDKGIVNAIVEINSHRLNKYELITETGHLKLDRVGYSSLAYPFTYGAIPRTLDLDGDPLDIIIANVTEPIAEGTLVEARVIGIMKFVDGGEVDDKIIAVLSDDKRVDHILTYTDLGEYWQKETKYYWEHYKDLKKPGTCEVKGFFDKTEAVHVIDEAVSRYQNDFENSIDEDDEKDCDCDCCSCHD